MNKMSTLVRLSAARLAQMIRAREVSSLDVVNAHIREIEKVNPYVHAIVADRFSDARREAHEADARLAKGTESLPPFHGVPCTIKENFAFVGMPNTSGIVSRIGYAPTEDATGVARLRAAGAIPLGVTNTSEVCMWMESDNRVYGLSRNPYDPSRTVGGSSGGEAAIIGAGASPFGLGSDVGGSIRMPAFFNGIFGHKATGGRVPNTGQYPTPENETARYCTTGPLCRRAEDLYPLLSILEGPDGKDPGAFKMDLGNPSDVDVTKLHVVNVVDDGRIFVTRDLRDAQAKVADYFRSRGMRVTDVSFPLLRDSLQIWGASLSAAGGAPFAELMGNGKRVNVWKEVAKYFVGRSAHTSMALGLGLIEEFTNTRRDLDVYVKMGLELRKQVEDALGDDGILLYPSHAMPAPKHHVPKIMPFMFAYTAILNILQIPVTQVPLGLNRKGAPLGIQVGAARTRDHLSIAAAIDLERRFGGWIPPKQWA